MSEGRDAAIVARLVKWFLASARELPWRTRPRDPYASLVSEFMLQQTQVSRVLEKFSPFLSRFPSIDALARAPEDEVLAAWSGLGYYRRARLLHAAAKAVALEHAGSLPTSAVALRSLPGIGRYTAGAIASIVHNQPEPIVDGNVARVLLRLEGREDSAAGAADWLWDRAASLVSRAGDAASPAAFNEGLMELGALVCTPRAPRCDACPLARECVARARGTQDRIPIPKTPAKQAELFCDVLLCRDAQGRTLVERRPDTGLWAGLWQAPTLEDSARAKTAATIARSFGVRASPSRVTTFDHATTHRLVRFAIWSWPSRHADALRAARPGSVFLAPAEIAALALSNPQRRVLLELPDVPARPATRRRPRGNDRP